MRIRGWSIWTQVSLSTTRHVISVTPRFLFPLLINSSHTITAYNPLPYPSGKSKVFSITYRQTVASFKEVLSPNFPPPQTVNYIAVDVSTCTLEAISQPLTWFSKQRWVGKSTSIPSGCWKSGSKNTKGPSSGSNALGTPC